MNNVEGGLIEADEEEAAKEFVADSPKGVIKTTSTAVSSSTVTGERTSEPPKDAIEEHRTVYRTDPHVGQSVNVVLDWMLSDGFNISPRNIPDTDEEQNNDDIAQLINLIWNSDFENVFHDWVKFAGVDGHSFMELVVEDEQFKPRILPAQRMHIKTDEYGNPVTYVLEPEDGGPESDDATQYEPHEIAELWFDRNPVEDFGHSWVERVKEQANMIRDMEIDFARFIATKAYPPILWKLGSEENQWTEEQFETWLDKVESIEPDSMLAAPHDVEAEAIGTTSTSSSAGAMRLEPTYQHLQSRIVTGIGVPAVLANMDSSGEPSAIMPSFKRRIRRYQQIVRNAVEQQILKSLMATAIGGSDSLEDYDGLVPEFEFGEYSSAEERLEVDKLIKLFNNGMLSREAFAKRAGIDPEIELPSNGELNDEIIPIIKELAGRGDSIQNPEGGSPTDTGGGAESAGGEVTSREDAGSDQSDGRNRQSPTEDEDV